MAVTRRQVLAAVAGVSVAGALGGGAAAWTWWRRPPGAGLHHLSTEEHDFVQALAEAYFPPGGVPRISGAEAELGAYMDDMVAAAAPALQTQLRLLLSAVDGASLPTHFRWFRQLDLATRVEVLQGWLNHDTALFRDGVTAIVALISLGYTSHPEVAATLQPLYRCGYGR